MPDYGSPPLFGVSVVPAADGVGDALALCRAADRSGLDLVGIQDHPYQRRFLDTLALIGHVLAQTERLRAFPDVANLPLRPPAVLAKAAASLDLLSGGRFELGLGAGGFWEAIRAMGGPDRTPGESVEALREGMEIIRLVWSEERSVSYQGRHYRLQGYRPGPPPAHPIEVWVGAYRPRMLRLVGELADGWVPSLFQGVTPEDLRDAHRRIDEAAEAAGRAPSAVRRIYNIPGRVGGRDEGPFAGGAARWVESLSELALRDGVSGFVVWPDGEDVRGQVERLAAEVAPAVRERVRAERRSS
jgi:alkanesulfonate monooxygenase SsuD/methylene tetrahydromethanopterin reductase-like flavin-dependent oxidoreductase (luciferase family)